jgi:hypothetical protein
MIMMIIILRADIVNTQGKRLIVVLFCGKLLVRSISTGAGFIAIQRLIHQTTLIVFPACNPLKSEDFYASKYPKPLRVMRRRGLDGSGSILSRSLWRS